jgi:hypothetical protein
MAVEETAKERLVGDIYNRVLQIITDCPKKFLDLKADVQDPAIKYLGEELEYGGYETFAAAVFKLEQEELIRPIKSHGLNGRRPPLYLRYRKLSFQKQDYGEVRKEILSKYHSQINLSHFLASPQEYEAVKDILLAIDRFLIETRDKPPRVWNTVNERSFMLTGDEKFLASPAGKRLLRLIGVSLSQLYCVATPEPFFYWTTGMASLAPDCTGCLIVENKDTFHTIKNLIAQQILTFSPPVQLLIYGEGKKILSSWPFIFECLPSLKIRFFYFGDLDPEGAAICADLIGLTGAGNDRGSSIETIPAEPLYLLLLDTAKSRALSRDQSRITAKRLNLFFERCRPEIKDRVAALWREGLVIPQEAVNASLLAAKGRIEL